MTEMIFIIFRENDNVIDITLCILLVRFKNLVHVPLHMAWTVAVSHKGDIPNFLSAMGNDSEFPTVFVCNHSLVKHFLEVKKGDKFHVTEKFDNFLLYR